MYCGLHTTKQMCIVDGSGLQTWNSAAQLQVGYDAKQIACHALTCGKSGVSLLKVDMFVGFHQHSDMQLAILLPKNGTAWLCRRPHSDSLAIPAWLDLERISQNPVLPPGLGRHLAQPDRSTGLSVASDAPVCTAVSSLHQVRILQCQKNRWKG